MTCAEGDGSSTITLAGQVPQAFFAEAGVHRWQRVPPTEKRGRVHTSTVTVAVLDGEQALGGINPGDVTYRFTRSRGNGGQNVNKRETACIARHEPTGIEVRCEDNRTQAQNQMKALELLTERVLQEQRAKATQATNSTRREQILRGCRSDDANRTVCVYRDEVRFASGGRMPLRQYMDGRHLAR